MCLDPLDQKSVGIPSGKPLHNYGKSLFWMGKSINKCHFQWPFWQPEGSIVASHPSHLSRPLSSLRCAATRTPPSWPKAIHFFSAPGTFFWMRWAMGFFDGETVSFTKRNGDVNGIYNGFIAHLLPKTIHWHSLDFGWAFFWSHLFLAHIGWSKTMGFRWKFSLKPIDRESEVHVHNLVSLR